LRFVLLVLVANYGPSDPDLFLWHAYANMTLKTEPVDEPLNNATTPRVGTFFATRAKDRQNHQFTPVKL